MLNFTGQIKSLLIVKIQSKFRAFRIGKQFNICGQKHFIVNLWFIYQVIKFRPLYLPSCLHFNEQFKNALHLDFAVAFYLYMINRLVHESQTKKYRYTTENYKTYNVM